ncbi:uncharacterized protein K460DRAFT_352458 [Cucurbitaria berberidis CBS 394.84]|uniref:Secreted protein n=1 Tax=Cucurbitaria berberidis CBS 394.84 TaxID=1168544 RepID=A0A9P4GJC7_9PLEO|nr:uncharacterized protein K460DRAFT_352458 [Cucurbitaria berberidis CBS 394.84]KAF1847303.1 hypothetical protein K460DRAFT_352458 [Cucurbitaria berberidis CBS 394.84]
MRSFFLLSLPALILAAPPSSPRITSLVFSGSGCPNNSGSVKSDTAYLGDNAAVSFNQLRGESTDNCAVHIQSTGGSQGWQVAVKEITYEGNVVLKGASELDTFTQVFWSENAGNTGVLTGGLTCSGPEIRDYVTVRSSTADLKWSKCTSADGNPGILNVNFRPVIQGEYGYYDFKHASWKLEWRRC